MADPELRVVQRELNVQLPATPLQHHSPLGCWLKRDDLGRFGTHKSRGVGVQMVLELNEGAYGFTISSSGNAARAAVGWSIYLDTDVIAFLSDKTEEATIESVVTFGVSTVVTPKAKNFSRYAARFAGLTDLRPSKHPHGSLGYRTLASEMTLQGDGPPSSVFCFCNSALTLLGIFEGFSEMRRRGTIDEIPQVHAVQCTANTVLAARVGAEARAEDDPVAGALGAQAPASLDRVSEAIASSGGSVWMVRNTEITAAEDRLGELGGQIAIESVAAVAGLMRAADAWDLGDKPVVVIGGERWSATRESGGGVNRPHRYRANTYKDVRELLESLGFGNRKPEVDLGR